MSKLRLSKTWSSLPSSLKAKRRIHGRQAGISLVPVAPYWNGFECEPLIRIIESVCFLPTRFK